MTGVARRRLLAGSAFFAALVLVIVLIVRLTGVEPNSRPRAALPGTVPASAPSVPRGIESMAAYVPANSCASKARPGTVKLARLLRATYPDTTTGTIRACGSLPDSEHYDGRAVDWMNSVRDPGQAQQAKVLISWLFADDEQGRPYANARRLGIMYVIWDNEIWGAYRAAEGWRPYRDCTEHPERSADRECHRDHIHLSLSWPGAMGVSSYWSGEVATPDYGRCREVDLNWAYGYHGPNPNRCRLYPKVEPPAGATPLIKTLTRASGRPLRKGSRGAVVSAVQQAVGTQDSGRYDAATVRAVKRWQRDHDLRRSGTITYPTWRKLLAAG